VNACGVPGPVRNTMVTVNPLVAAPAVTIIDVAGGPFNIPQFTTIDFSALVTDPANLSKSIVWKVDGTPVFTTMSTSAAFFQFPNAGSFTWTFAVCGIHTVNCEITFAGQPAPPQCYSPNVSISNTLTYNVCATGVDEILSGEENVLLSPNPSTGDVKVESSGMKIQRIELYNALGERLLFREIRKHQTTLDIRTLPPGIYFVKVSDGARSVVKRIVKM
jgi:hypothetical protein